MSFEFTKLFNRPMRSSPSDEIDITKIQKAAHKLYNKYYRSLVIPGVAPIYAETIAKKEGITLEYVSALSLTHTVKLDIQGQTKGILAPKSERSLSPVQLMMQERWKNFGIAHLLGHIVLGHDIQKDTFDPSVVADSDITPQDREANIFASFLLMPDPVLQRRSEPHNKEQNFPPSAFLAEYNYPLKAIDLRRSLLPDSSKHLIFSQEERLQYVDFWKENMSDTFASFAQTTRG